jgi:hypothetical protein
MRFQFFYYVKVLATWVPFLSDNYRFGTRFCGFSGIYMQTSSVLDFVRYFGENKRCMVIHQRNLISKSKETLALWRLFVYHRLSDLTSIKDRRERPGGFEQLYVNTLLGL